MDLLTLRFGSKGKRMRWGYGGKKGLMSIRYEGHWIAAYNR